MNFADKSIEELQDEVNLSIIEYWDKYGTDEEPEVQRRVNFLIKMVSIKKKKKDRGNI